MNGYVLSVLGIVMAGVIIDIIVPSGTINKYIKSIYSIFVVAVLVSPIINLLKKSDNITLHYNDYEISESLLNFIHVKQAETTENNIETELLEGGFKNIDIKIEFSAKNNELVYNSCQVFLQNLVIDLDKQHINKYEFIREVVIKHTNLTQEVIIFNEW